MRLRRRDFFLTLFPAALFPAAFCIPLLILTEPIRAGSSAGLMDISADGRLLACTNRDSGTVTIVENLFDRFFD